MRDNTVKEVFSEGIEMGVGDILKRVTAEWRL